MATFAVFYRYTDDAAGRDQHRPEHRAFLNASDAVLLAGPMTEPAGALILVRAENRESAEKLLDADPFYREQLVAERTVRDFTPSSGALASHFAK